jgi:hypothetical protein
MVGIPDRVGYVAHNPWQRSLGIQGASNHEFGRHALLGSRLRFTDATLSYWRRATALFSLSRFNFSADGTQ